MYKILMFTVETPLRGGSVICLKVGVPLDPASQTPEVTLFPLPRLCSLVVVSPSISRELSVPVLWPKAQGANSQDVPWPLSRPTTLAAQGLDAAGLSVLGAGELTVLEGGTIRGSFSLVLMSAA